MLSISLFLLLHVPVMEETPHLWDIHTPETHTGSMNRPLPNPAPYPLLLRPPLLGFGGLLTLLAWSEVVPASETSAPCQPVRVVLRVGWETGSSCCRSLK